MEYEDFVLSVTPGNSGEIGLATSGPLQGDARGSSRFPFSPEEWARLYAVLAEEVGAAPLSAAEIQALGAKLFAALFPEPILRALERIETRLEGDAERRLRIRLQLNVRDPEALRFASLPWELAFSPERGGFLFLGGKVSLVRHLELQRGIRPPLEGNLRVLIASAEPRGVPPLDVETEIQAIEAALGRVAQADLLKPLYQATAQSLRDALVQNAPVHVLHFLGHSNFDPETGEGCLILEGAFNKQIPLPAHRLANLLRDQESLRLAVLNACWSGRATDRPDLDPFAGLASALVRDGVPAVVAMQFPVRGSAAGIFSEKLYEQLAKNAPLDAAVAEGRIAIQIKAAEAGGSSVSWAIPALYSRSQDGLLFAPGVDPGKASEEIRREVRNEAKLIRDRTRDFVGREWLFAEIDRFRTECESGYFVLRGDPGIGKTALVAQLVKMRGAPYFFNQRSEGINTPSICHRSLCAQLIEAFGLRRPSLPPQTGQDGRILSELLDECAGKLRSNETALLLIDALDEADARAERDGANVHYLPTLLPPGFFAVATMRKETRTFRFTGRDFLLDPTSSENQADARALIVHHIERPALQEYLAEQGLESESFVESLADKSQGNFMYLRNVLADLEKGNYRGRPFEKLPRELEGYYRDQMAMMEHRYPEDWVELHRPLIALLTVANEPLSLSALATLLEKDLGRVRLTLERWAPFLHDIRRVDAEGRTRVRVNLYHESFKEYLEHNELAPEEIDHALDRLTTFLRPQ